MKMYDQVFSTAIAIILLSVPVSTCFAGDDAYREADHKIESFFRAKVYPSRSDYVWLVKKGAFGGWDRLGIYYGFADNYGFCVENSKAYMERFPGSEFSCERLSDTATEK